MDTKYVCVIVDDFTGRALEYPNVHLWDYGQNLSVTATNLYYYDYYTDSTYGRTSDTATNFDIRAFYPDDQFFSPREVASGSEIIGLNDYNAVYDLYMTEHWGSYSTVVGLTPIDPASESGPGHGDWVLESFFQQIDDPSSVEVIAIDCDFTSFNDFSTLFSAYDTQMSVLEAVTTTAVNSFYDSNNTYVMAGLSASWGGMTPIPDQLQVVGDLIYDWGSYVLQAVANVNQESIPWGYYEENVINVGAYNVDQGGYILAGDETGYPVIDLLANGYVEEPSWGWNFGTSFATPRVFSEIVNYYDENLSPQIESGDYVPEPIQLDDEPHTEEEVSAFVNGVVDAISTDLWVSLSDTPEPTIVPVMTDDISDGLVPVTVPVSASDSGLIFMEASTTAPVTNTYPVAASDNLIVAENSGQTLVDVLANDTDVDGHTLTITAVSDSTLGTVTTDGSQISFTPDSGAYGTESLTYYIDDGNGGTGTGTLDIVVEQANEPVGKPVNELDTDGGLVTLTITAAGGKYYVDGVQQDTPRLDAGNTYIFDGSSASSHPLAFSTTPDGTHAGGTLYTEGVTDLGNNRTQLMVDSETPDLHYFCLAHPGMGDQALMFEDIIEVPENLTLGTEIGLTANALDPDSLDTASYGLTNDAGGRFVINPQTGQVRVATDTALDYETESEHQIDIKATSTDGTESVSRFALNLTNQNENPTGQATAILVDGTEDVLYVLSEQDLVDGFTDVEGDPISAHSIAGFPGTLTDNQDGTYTIDAGQDTHGSWTLSYQVTDDKGGSTSATLSLTIDPVNDDPVAVVDILGVSEDASSILIGVLSNDTDVENDTLSVSAPVADNGGAVSVVGNQISYQPAPDFHGTETITYTVDDGNGGTNTGTVMVTVAPVNDDPTGTASAPLVDGAEDNSYMVTEAELLQGFNDIDGDELSVTNLSPSVGRVVDDLEDATAQPGGVYRFVPDAGYRGPVSLSYEVDDGHGGVVAAVQHFDVWGPVAESLYGSFSGEVADQFYGSLGSDQLYGFGGDDYLSGGPGDDEVFGGVGVDQLFGGLGADTLNGDAGDDYLDGGEGADVLSGGQGHDVYVVDGSDVVLETQGGLVGGTDRIMTSSDWVWSTPNVEEFEATGTEHIRIAGNELNNLILGNVGDNVLSGGEGTDIIEGREGSDDLDGGSGRDRMIGGLGHDRYWVDGSRDIVTEDAGAGIDHVYASVDHVLASHLEDLTLLGSGDIGGTGNDLDNVVTGNDGNNLLSGGYGGVDTLIGGAGDDTYKVYAEDTVINDSSGTDLIISTVSLTLADGIENGELSGFARLDLTGNGLSNDLSGSRNDNVLDGKGGADTLTGGGRSDTFVSSVSDGTYDTITDFASGDDGVAIDADVYGLSGLALLDGLSEAVLDMSHFATIDGDGVSSNVDAHLIYDTRDQMLRVDADGSGAGAEVAVFALAGTSTAIDYDDILLFKDV